MHSTLLPSFIPRYCINTKYERANRSDTNKTVLERWIHVPPA